jgi:hypothetical protein
MPVEGTKLDGSRVFRVEIHENESDSLGERSIGLVFIRIAPDSRVTGPVGDGTQEDGSGSRFDTNGRAGIRTDEILNAVAAFNTDASIGGEEVSLPDVLEVITGFNSS